MKKLICLLLTLALMAGLPMTVRAEGASNMGIQKSEEESRVLSAYRVEDSLHCFATFAGGVPSADTVKLISDSGENTEQLTVSGIQSCALESPVHLVLLVDNSIHMKDNSDTLLAFAEELMAKGSRNLSVTVATQALRFQILAENVTDGETLKEVLRGIVYDETYVANPMAGLANALKECFPEEDYQQGKMQNLLIFTNGVASMDPKDRPIYRAKAKTAMKESPQVLVHSVILSDKNTEERKTLEEANGIQILLADEQPQDAADEIARYLNTVHRVEITDPKVKTLDLSALSLKYSLLSGGDVVFHDVPLGTVTDIVLKEAGDPPEVTEGTEPPTKEEVPPASETEDATIADPTDTQPEDEPTQTETDETEETRETVSDPDDVTGSSGGSVSGDTGIGKILFFAGIGVVVLALLVAILILIFRRRGSDAIAMRLVVEYGNVPNIREWYYLKDSLYLGSGRGCDVVIPESLVDKKNTRIYLEKGQIFVEDLGSRSGTLLGGSKLHGPNYLRSGDLVTVGNTSIRFLF